MANVLVVNAHPLSAEDSQTVTILDTFIEAHQASHPEDVFTMLDLYYTDLPEIDGDLLLAWKSLQKGTDFTELSSVQQEKVRVFNDFDSIYIEGADYDPARAPEIMAAAKEKAKSLAAQF